MIDSVRRLIPPRRGWLGLTAAPSSYLLIASLVIVGAVKAAALVSLGGLTAWPLVWLWAIGLDALVHAGLAALFVVGEARRPWIIAFTIPLGFLVSATAAVNAAYLAVSGEQLSWEAVEYGLDSWDELVGVAAEIGKSGHGFLAILVLLVLILVPWAARRAIRRRGEQVPSSDRRADRSADRIVGPPAAHCAAALAGIALLGRLLAPAPDLLPAARLGHNAVLDTYWGWLTGADRPQARSQKPRQFAGYHPHNLVDQDAIRAFARGPRPNLVVLILESTRYDATSLADRPGRSGNALSRWAATQTARSSTGQPSGRLSENSR